VTPADSSQTGAFTAARVGVLSQGGAVETGRGDVVRSATGTCLSESERPREHRDRLDIPVRGFPAAAQKLGMPEA